MRVYAALCLLVEPAQRCGQHIEIQTVNRNKMYDIIYMTFLGAGQADARGAFCTVWNISARH